MSMCAIQIYAYNTTFDHTIWSLNVIKVVPHFIFFLKIGNRNFIIVPYGKIICFLPHNLCIEGG